MKKILTLVMLITSAAVMAQFMDDKTGLYFSYPTGDNTYLMLVSNMTVVVQYTGHVTIPDSVTPVGSIDALPVKRIADYAMANQNLLSSVSIPKTVTMIDTCAIAFCDSLMRVFMYNEKPEDMTINSGAFDFGTRAVSLYVPRAVLPKYKAITYFTQTFKGGIYPIDDGELTVTASQYEGVVEMMFFLVDNVNQYTVEVKKGNTLQWSFTYDAQGKLLSSKKYMPAATLDSGKTEEFIVVSLGPVEAGAQYSYEVKGVSAKQEQIYQKSGTFVLQTSQDAQPVITHTDNTVTNIESANEHIAVQKIMNDGKVYIIYQDDMYNLQGQKVKIIRRAI